MTKDFQMLGRDLAMAALVTVLLAPASSQACQICFPNPRSSAVDQILEAEMVVLAREDPQNPNSLRALEVVKGDPAVAGTDLFVDGPPGPSLGLNPRRKVVCAYRPDGENPGWQRVGIADNAFGPLVSEILERGPAWKTDPDQRVQFFAKLLSHTNPQVSALAHLEVARAPYNRIREFGGIIPNQDLRAFLSNVRLSEWHALYILLLAQSGEQEDRDLIAEKVRSAASSSTTRQLAAWVTAWIEAAEGEPLSFLTDQYLANPDRKAEEVTPVLAAFSVHGTRGHVHLRDRIVEGYRTALESHPALAPRIVSDLMAWERWELDDPVAAVLESPPDALDRTAILQLRAYLNRAIDQQPGPEGASPGPGGGGGWGGLVGVVLAILILLPVGIKVASHAKQRRHRAA